jgi:hypothetical protein
MQELTAGQKAALARRRRQAGKKAALARKRRAAGRKAADKRRNRYVIKLARDLESAATQAGLAQAHPDINERICELRKRLEDYLGRDE